MKGFFAILLLISLAKISKVSCLFLGPIFGGTLDASSARFFLWTRAQTDYEILEMNNVSNVTASNFDGSKRTIVIMHGWTKSALFEPLIGMKDAFISQADVNVIGVDWEDLAKNDWYPWPVQSSYSVSWRSAEFIKFLKENFGLSESNVHIVGHSLGAHVAGMTGRFMQLQGMNAPDRVTGLDPASVLFRFNGWKIGPSSGAFVDIIHTSSCLLCKGLPDRLGHVDFYPNGGKNQPGCTDGFFFDDTCSHTIAYDFFTESIVGNTKFRAAKCNSYADYESGSCTCDNSDCLNMGFPVDRNGAQGSYYLKTNPSAPYAQG